MAERNNQKSKGNCNHSFYEMNIGWCCDKYGECFMCSLCKDHEPKEDLKCQD